MKNTETLMICARFNLDKRKMENFLLPLDKVWFLPEDQFKVGETSVEYETSDLTEIELRAKAIETLKAKQKSIMAIAQKEKEALNVKIEQLLCLTYEPKDDKVVKTETESEPEIICEPAPVPPAPKAPIEFYDFDDDIPF